MGDLGGGGSLCLIQELGNSSRRIFLAGCEAPKLLSQDNWRTTTCSLLHVAFHTRAYVVWYVLCCTVPPILYSTVL